MNSPDSFEQKLQRQKPRELPPGWRDDVLRTAQEVAIEHARRTAGRRQPTSPATWRRVLTNLFWPHPLAWGGLAAAWLIILVLNIASSDPAEHRMASEASPPSPEVRELLRE